jgi:hypothetical protein
MHRVLVLHLTPRPRAARLSTRQHLEALSRLDEPAEVLTYNAVQGAPSWLRRLRFDVVVLHTTLLCARWHPWFGRWKHHLDWVADAAALKIAFPQDDYNHAHVLDAWLDELGVSVVCTVLDDQHRGELYPTLSRKAAFHDVLTGYIDEGFATRFGPQITTHPKRSVDIVYRASKLPYWFGSHGQTKHVIGEVVAAEAQRQELSHDISTRSHESIVGEAWLDFLGSGRATIGTESGSSALDARGEIQARVRELLQARPNLRFDDVARELPAGWDAYRFLAISPRHLEAVVTKTAQVLVRGHYSGVLEAETHYIPIKPDFSDVDSALERLRDPGVTERIAERAYADIFLSGRWNERRLTNVLTTIVREHALTASGRGGIAFAVGVPLAKAQSGVERTVLAPASAMAASGPDGLREAAAGARLFLTDQAVRRLLLNYLRSTKARENVSPRVALADLLCLGYLRGRTSAEHFAVHLEIDHLSHRLTLRSGTSGVHATNAAPTRDELARLLSERAWELTWDHSAIGQRARFSVVGSLSTPLPLAAGLRRLPTLNWLARDQPRDVAAAIAPLISRAGTGETFR